MDCGQPFLFIIILYKVEYRRYTIEFSAKGHDLMCDLNSVSFTLNFNQTDGATTGTLDRYQKQKERKKKKKHQDLEVHISQTP